MMAICDLHMHTTFCDGENTCEEMIAAAYEGGFESVGLSSHSSVPFENEYGIKEPERYRAEVRRLREKYRGKIKVYLGMEQDVFSAPAIGYDYIIGSVHTIRCGDAYIEVDQTPEVALAGVREYFGGDWLGFVRAYYELAAEEPRITGADIVAHFDLVTKFNGGNRFFDEESREYRSIAYEALKCAARECRIFEINSGGIRRCYRKRVYPDAFLLKAIRELGGRIIFSSDAHDAASVGFMFDEMAALARACGFERAMRMTPSGFASYSLK